MTQNSNRQAAKRIIACLMAALMIFGGMIAMQTNVEALAPDEAGILWSLQTDAHVQGFSDGAAAQLGPTPMQAAGPVTITAAQNPADDGLISLAITGRSADWHGIDIPLAGLLAMGMSPAANEYRIYVSARRITPADGNAVIALRGNIAPWADMTVSNTTAAAGETLTIDWIIDFEALEGRDIRIQSANAAMEFTIDEIRIERVGVNVRPAAFTLQASGEMGAQTSDEIEITFVRDVEGPAVTLANVTLDGGTTGAVATGLTRLAADRYVLGISGVVDWGIISVSIAHADVSNVAANTALFYAGFDLADLVRGPAVLRDELSPTGYTVQFVLHRPGASAVMLSGAFGLRDFFNPGNNAQVSPFDFVPGLVPYSQYNIPMISLGGDYWFAALPLPGGTYSYWFTVAGQRIYDPANPPFQPDGHNLMNLHHDMRHSAVAVPWCAEKQHEINNRDLELPLPNPADRGQVVSSRFESSIAAGPSGPGMAGFAGDLFGYLLVYLPPGHDPGRAEPYPVIYMVHGWWNDATSWMNGAAIPHTMDNLITRGYVEPTIVVSINNTRHGLNYVGGDVLTNSRNDFIEYVMPHVEATFNASSNPAQRAVGGYSLGSAWAAHVYSTHSAHLRHYGIFSPPMGPGAGPLSEVPAADRDASVHVMGHGVFASYNYLNTLRENVTNDFTYVTPGGHERHAWAQLFTIWVRDHLWGADAAERPPAPITTLPAQHIMRFAIGSTAYTLRGVSQQLDNAPFVDRATNRTMVPLRAIAEGLGAVVDWDDATRTVTLTQDGRVVELTIGQPLPNDLGVAAIVGGNTFVPLRFIAEAFGSTIVWDDENRAAYIY